MKNVLSGVYWKSWLQWFWQEAVWGKYKDGGGQPCCSSKFLLLRSFLQYVVSQPHRMPVRVPLLIYHAQGTGLLNVNNRTTSDLLQEHAPTAPDAQPLHPRKLQPACTSSAGDGRELTGWHSHQWDYHPPYNQIRQSFLHSIPKPFIWYGSWPVLTGRIQANFIALLAPTINW